MKGSETCWPRLPGHRITPFCSCLGGAAHSSAVVSAAIVRVPLGVTFSFLIAAPMVNEVALGLLFGLVGWKVALTYLVFGLAVAIVAGWVSGGCIWSIGLRNGCAMSALGQSRAPSTRLDIVDRIKAGLEAVRDIVGRAWPWMLAGIGAGALIHGYAPAELAVRSWGAMRGGRCLAAVVIGIPMYSNAAGIIPVVEALIGKGAALGTVLAFMMSVTALSLPEMIIPAQGADASA